MDEPQIKKIPPPTTEKETFVDRFIRFCLQNKLIVGLFLIVILAGGLVVAPFDWDTGGLPREPVAVDAIPDIGPNQQIVFTKWPGRSPQDVEDQITYPLTVSLLGVPGVKTVRSKSMFGFSSIYIIFEEDVDFYWSRSRVLTKLNSLSAGTLPDGVQPALGPDATALGQIYWYTLEGRGPDGEPTGGWDPQELRTIQDWYVRYELTAVKGVSEIASVGGFQKEYQIDVDPDAMRAHRVTLEEIFKAVKSSNVDVGARTIEVNRTEYMIRGLGFIENEEDIRNTVVKTRDNVPIYVKDVAHISKGPAGRRAALDKAGAEAVGAVAVVRYGFNPLEAIKNLKAKIDRIEPGLPSKAVIDWDIVKRDTVTSFASEEGFSAFTSDNPDELNQDGWKAWLRGTPQKQWPEWVTLSQVHIVPFYDRSELIQETLGTLNDAIVLQILVTIIVVIGMVFHLRSSLLISATLPLAVLMTFGIMKLWGVPANIVSLSGIAISIGTMVAVGIFICENILTHLRRPRSQEYTTLDVVYGATSEIGTAVLTAVSTTVVSFLPVFTMTGAEGKLFGPVAFTKTFAMVASLFVAFAFIPPIALWLFTGKLKPQRLNNLLKKTMWHKSSIMNVVAILIISGAAGFLLPWWVGLLVAAGGFSLMAAHYLPETVDRFGPWLINGAALLAGVILLSHFWQPLGPEKGAVKNLAFVVMLVGGFMALFHLFKLAFRPVLRWSLDHKLAFLSIPFVLLLVGVTAWQGIPQIFGFVPASAERMGGDREKITENALWKTAEKTFPGFEKEFMPPLDEGSFLYMPVTMPHASIGEALDVLQKLDKSIYAIPEVNQAVGKIGRVDSPLDPAPISMIETIINYKSEYITDENGRRINFRYNKEEGKFVRDTNGDLIRDPDGRPFRQWRDHIRTSDDIWDEIVRVAKKLPGTTVAPKLMPIKARVVMLQSGMRAPMGVKVKGPDLKSIEEVTQQVEKYLKQVPGVEPASVVADRIIGKPYIEIDIDRNAIARYGMSIKKVQNVIEVAIGGKRITRTVEGRERYNVRVRYKRELRDRIETLGNVLVPAPGGAQVPLKQLAEISYTPGPMAIKSEDTRLVGYVVFDKKAERAEVDVVQEAQRYLKQKRAEGEFTMPSGVNYEFAGSYKNQIRARKTLAVVVPIALFIIFLILYLQFKSVPTTLVVFSSIFLAAAGGFILIWLYAQPWFFDLEIFGRNIRKLFQIHEVNMSTAIWVGFLAMFGVAADNSVVMATYMRRRFQSGEKYTTADVRNAALEGAVRPIRPCLMTAATTVLALLPVLTSTGRGSDVMVPMAIPTFGGMFVVLLSFFMVPVLYSLVEELRMRFKGTTTPKDAIGKENAEIEKTKTSTE